ncbi:MAG: alpha/beta fold hydrolase [Anaerolineae bacterium]|nr:alpha/beta fold hydrolase [Anaerolineae bacterium]
MNRGWLWLCCLLLVFMLAACDDDYGDEYYEDETDQIVGEQNTPASMAPGTYRSATCPFAVPRGYRIECGYLTVPENRQKNNTRTIQLAVAVVKASGQTQPDPIIYLAGGPGGSAIDDFVADPEGWGKPFVHGRDLILLDQRGTGYSIPSLDCPEFAEMEADENPDRACYDRLSRQGIDFSAYNTAENAADVAALRLALGIESWNLLGISYGTRLALDVMRYHPQGVRAAVLDSVFPPNADTPLEDVLSTVAALERLFAECDADAYCSQEYPDLRDLFLETVARLNEDQEGEIFGDDLLFAIGNAFNDTTLIPLLPYVIYEVADGNYEVLDEIGFETDYRRPRYQDEDRSDSEGMYNSVMCYDEYAVGDYERVERAVVGQIPEELEAGLLQSVFDLTTMCAFWNPRSSVDNSPVRSSVPTLILAGQYDVATPVYWAHLTAQTLTNAYVYEFPGAGHSLLTDVDCAMEITAQFLSNPSRQPNGSCIAAIEWPNFE